MLYIDPNTSDVQNALKAHVSFMHCRISKKVFGTTFLEGPCKEYKGKKLSRYKSTDDIIEKVKKYLEKDDMLMKILTGLPKELEAYHHDFFKKVLPVSEEAKLSIYFKASGKTKKEDYPIIHSLVSDLNKIFNYNWFVGLSVKDEYSTYHLADILNRRSCTYCNRTFTTTMVTKNKEKLMRPQLDHWFPKSKFPLLALSFYNLIPSCYTCNSSVKGDIELNLKDHIHPYVDATQINDFTFDYFYAENLENYNIFMVYDENNTKAINTLKTLKIDEMYNAHHEELDDLIKIRKAYSSTYIENIKEFFPNHELTDKEIYRLLFGTELDETDFHLRPMSKFKKDILKELGIID